MRRNAWAVLLLTAACGCVSVGGGPETGGGPTAHYGRRPAPPSVPGVQYAWGEKMPMAAPYTSAPPANEYQARRMMAASMPLDMVQMNPLGPGQRNLPPGAGVPPTPVPPGGILSPPGVPFAPGVPAGPGVNQASFLPGGPGGVVNANIPPGRMPPGGVIPAQAGGGPGVPPGGAPAGGAGVIRFPNQRSQVRFERPAGMKVFWFTMGPDGKPAFSTVPIETPGRYNFMQGAVYRLKITNIAERPGLEIYPTMEVVPANPKTEAFLAHSAIKVEFTPEDFKQIAEGNYVVKVIYLPDPQYQDVAGTGTDTILSTRLEPGADPIQEALRRGSILLIIRMGNVDQEAPNTPPLGAPGAGTAAPKGPPLMGMPGPGFQVPYLGMPGMPGMLPPGAMGPVPFGPPPGMMPPGSVPPGMIPPGMVPPGKAGVGGADDKTEGKGPTTPPPGIIPPGLIPGGPGAPTIPPTGAAPVPAPSAAPAFPGTTGTEIPAPPSTTPPDFGPSPTTPPAAVPPVGAEPALPSVPPLPESAPPPPPAAAPAPVPAPVTAVPPVDAPRSEPPALPDSPDLPGLPALPGTPALPPTSMAPAPVPTTAQLAGQAAP